METGAPNRLYARVAEALKARICKGEFVVGQRLPAERVLAIEYEVSRPTIREALFALEIGGFVEVRVGSGVYVLANVGAQEGEGADMGPFEILEARRLIEGEVCALAAARISPEQVEELQQLLGLIDHSSDGNLKRSEEADRRFHILIAEATQNSALVNAVEALWDARERSPEYRLMAEKAHAAGVVPIVDEHAAIIQALLAREPANARDAMHQHLGRVLDSILAATEVHEVELARERVAAQRRKFISSR